MIMKCCVYIIYRFFTDIKKVIAVIILLFLNFITFFLYTGSDGENISSGEISGNNSLTTKQTVVNTVMSADEFYRNLRLVCNTAEQNLEIQYETEGLQTEYERNVLNIYGHITESVRLSDSDFLLSGRYFLYSYDLVYLAIIIFIFTASVYIDDYSFDLLPVLHTVKHGRLTLAFAKLTALFSASFAMVLISSSASMVLYGKSLPLSSAIQVLPEMALCPYVITVWQYFIISCIIKIAVLFVFALVCLLFVSYTYNILICCVWATGIAAINVVLADAITAPLFSPLRYISLYTIGAVTPLMSRYRAVSWFGRLYHAASFVFLYLIIAAAVLVFANVMIYCFHRPVYTANKLTAFRFFKKICGKSIQTAPGLSIVRKLRSQQMKPEKSYSLSLFSCELYKIIISSHIWIILLMFFTASVYTGTQQYKAVTAFEKIYRDYMTYYSGDTVESSIWNKEKSADIYGEAVKLDDEQKLWDQAENRFLRNEISIEEYEKTLSLYSDIPVRRDAFRQVETVNHYLSLRSDTMKIGFVYDTGWNAFFRRSPDLYLYMSVLLLGSCLFSTEHDAKTSAYGMAVVLKTMRYGRKQLFNTKINVLIACCISGAILSEITSVYFITQYYTFPLPNAAATSLPLFAGLDLPVSLFGMAVICEFLRVFCLLVFSLFVGCLSELFKKRLPAIITGTGILLFPVLFEKSGVEFLKYFNFYTYAGGYSGLALSLGHPLDFLIIFIMFVFFTTVTVLSLLKCYRKWVT